MFGVFFDEERHYPSYNVRDLDTNDKNVQRDILDYLSKHDDFDFLLCHLLGIDHAGHTFHADHSEITRKITETEQILKEVINAMDNNTVLLINGDHGMTLEGNHGGDSPKETRTVFFAYTKSGFPMLKSKSSNFSLISNSLSSLKL